MRAIMIKRVLWSACLMAAVAAGPGVSAAQSSHEGAPLRVQWEADPPRDGLQAVCGRVFNDRRWPPGTSSSSWKRSMERIR